MVLVRWLESHQRIVWTDLAKPHLYHHGCAEQHLLPGRDYRSIRVYHQLRGKIDRRQRGAWILCRSALLRYLPDRTRHSIACRCQRYRALHLSVAEKRPDHFGRLSDEWLSKRHLGHWLCRPF